MHRRYISAAWQHHCCHMAEVSYEGLLLPLGAVSCPAKGGHIPSMRVSLSPGRLSDMAKVSPETLAGLLGPLFCELPLALPTCPMPYSPAGDPMKRKSSR
jgi:hypothetical protein